MKYYKYIHKIYVDFTNPRSLSIRNNICFAIIMSIVPLVALLTVASLHVINSTDWIVEMLSGFIPAETINSLIEVGLNTSNMGFIPFIIMIAVSYWSAARGFYTLIISFSDEKIILKELVRKYTIQSLFAPFIFIALVILVIFSNITFHLLFPNTSYFFNMLTTLGIYVFISFIFFALISTRKQRFKHSIYGAIFFAIAMTILSNLFFWYINRFTHYNDIYGGLASIMVTILAIKTIASILHMSHIINELSEKGLEQL